jgi:hypothetical protein
VAPEPFAVEVAVGVGVKALPDRAERVQVRRLGDTGRTAEGEAVQHIKAVQDGQPHLGGAQRVQQDAVDLLGG